MAKKSKGVKRLAIVVGLLSVGTLFGFNIKDISDILLEEGTLGKVIPFLLTIFLVVYLIGWGVVRMIYWVYCGFKNE